MESLAKGASGLKDSTNSPVLCCDTLFSLLQTHLWLRRKNMEGNFAIKR